MKMKNKYFLLGLLFLSNFMMIQGQTHQEPMTKKERKAKKKAQKNKKIKTAEVDVFLESKPETIKVNKKDETTLDLPTASQQTVIQNDKSIQQILTDLSLQSKEVIETKPNGNVNWSQQYIEAIGQAVIDHERFKNPAQAKLMASRGAVVVAQRNLLEIVKGVHIVGETTVQDMMTTSDYVYTRVEGVIKGAQQVGEVKEMNGYVEVRLRMPIYGNGSLANTFDDNSLTNAKKKNGLAYDSNIFQQANDANSPGIDGSKPILFNIENSENIDPSMFPVIVDDNNNVLFDFSKIYNPNKGSFPQYLQLTKEVLAAYGNDKGVDLINIIQTGQGKFKIPEKSSKNVFWNKVARVAQDVGTVLFKLIL
jgi:hypothetical protein